MASDTAQPDTATTDGSDSIEIGAPELAWAQAWQIPVLLLGLGLLTVGLYLALPKIIPPEYDAALEAIDTRIQANELERAEQDLDALRENQDFLDNAGDPRLGYQQQLYADLRFRQLESRVWQGINTDVGTNNLRKVVDHYQRAERKGHELPPPALRRYAQTLATLGEDQFALDVIDRLPPSSVADRQELVKSLINRRRLTEPDPSSLIIARLLERFEREVAADKDPVNQRRQQIWAMELRGKRLLLAKDPDAVVRMLVEGGIQRLLRQGATEVELAPLHVLLGEAMTVQSDFVNARIHLRKAQQNIPEGSPLGPRIHLAMAEIELAQEESPGREERAYQLFRQAYDADTMGPTSVSALTGLGLTESLRPGRFAEGIEYFRLAVDRLENEQAPDWDPRRKKLSDYLHERAESEFARTNYLNAIDLLDAIKKLQQPAIGAELYLSFARSYQKLAEASLAQAAALEPDYDQPGQDPRNQARRIHHQDAANYFEQAGDNYYARAQLMTQMTEEHGEALWLAAESYDAAQLWDEAAQVYLDFLATSGDQPKREEAMFRLGQAYLAADMPAAAIERFEELIEKSDNSAFAHEAYVPMARAYQAAEEWDKAEKMLTWVTRSHPSIGPTSPYFRDALIELGGFYYRRGQDNPEYYARAIEVLGEDGGALGRYCRPGLPEEANEEDERKKISYIYGPRLRFMLADSLRLSAAGLLKRAQDSRSEVDRLAAQAERLQRLQAAQMYYNQTLTELDGRHAASPESLEPIERVYHRNAYFYQADCAFARGDYANAILLYQDAAQRWQDHPASLVAWVQIINAAAEMGDYERAKAAHRQANELFDRLPPEVFDHPDALMTRQRWDDWLRWSTQLDLYSTSPGANAGVPTGN